MKTIVFLIIFFWIIFRIGKTAKGEKKGVGKAISDFISTIQEEIEKAQAERDESLWDELIDEKPEPAVQTPQKPKGRYKEPRYRREEDMGWEDASPFPPPISSSKKQKPEEPAAMPGVSRQVSGQKLKEYIIWSEILGKPKALRED